MATDTRTLPEPAEIESRVLTFLERELLSPGVSVARDADLLSGEVLTSMSVLRLAAFVSEEFQIGMQPSDFVIEHFRNVAVIADYVRRAAADRVPNASKDERR